MCQTSYSLFDVWFSTCHFYQSNCDITKPPSFRKFPQTAEECCKQKHFLNPLQTGKSRQIEFWQVRSVDYPAPLCVKLVIHYLTCGFRPVISTDQNVTSRGPPIFGSFCKLLRNVVTETFAENWEVPSNQILTIWCTVSDLSVLPVNIKCSQFSESSANLWRIL